MVRIVAMPCLCADVFEATGDIFPGGEALNFAANACRYPHAQVEVMGAIGDDAEGRAVMQSILARPIGHERVRVVAGGRTGRQLISLTEDGDRYFKPGSWDSGVYADFRMDEEDRACLANADWVFCTYYSPNFREVVAWRRSAGFKLAVDFDIDRDWAKLEPYLPCIDLFFISGIEALLPHFRAWSERYDGLFNVTLAEKGSVTYRHGREYRVSAVPVAQVIDTTGCGDSYHAGFLYRYALDGDILAAMNEGSRVASRTLSHMGGFR